MNKGYYEGRLTRDPELRVSGAGTSFGSFTMAIDRPGSKDKTDFVPFVCVGKTAENVCKYLKKGSMASVSGGSLQTSSYDNKDGVKIYKTEIFAYNVKFLSSVKDSGSSESSNYGIDPSEFQAIEDDDDIPF